MTAVVPDRAGSPTVVARGRHRGEETDWRPPHRCSVQRHVEEGWVASARIREGVLVLTSGGSTSKSAVVGTPSRVGFTHRF